MDGFGLRILVVDDDNVSRQILSTLIQQSGQEAIEACDGHDGLAKIREFRPDIVIARRQLPAMGGIDLVRKVRAVPEDYRPYVILVGRPEEKAELLEAGDVGIDDFIEHPLTLEMLSAQLRAAQRIARLQRENERCLRKLQQYSTELTCSNLRLRELAITDDLTGLPNRPYSMELMKHEWSVANGEDSPLSCMVIDLDGLKQINDEQGLERGDVVLKTVAAIMRKYLPPQDKVCRISGDEFLVICPGASLNAVMARGEKLVTLVRSFNIHAQDYPLGLNIGVAERRAGVDGPQELINLAEQAMHHAKGIGRNQVCPGQGAERRVARGAGNARQADESGRRKSKKQFPLWRHADALETVAAGA